MTDPAVGPAERTCAGCGDAFTGNHRVRDGEPHCRDCEPLAVGRGLPSPEFEPAETIEEYEARKAVMVPVAELLDIEPRGAKRDEVGRAERATGERGGAGCMEVLRGP